MLQSKPVSFKGNRNNNAVENVNNSLLKKKSIFDSIEADKISEGKYFTDGNLHSNNQVKFSNVKRNIYQLDDHYQVSKSEDYLETFKPLEQDNEIEKLRKQAKDLAI